VDSLIPRVAVSKPLLEQRWPWFLAAGVVVAVFLSTIVEIRSPGDWDRRPLGSADEILRLRDRDDVNVLFILIDTLRADRLGSYGYERDTSPTLDRLARSGVRFDRHLAQSSWTKASMASLWTSLNPARTGILRYDDMIPEVARMPAEILRDAGFQTVALYRNGWVAPTFGFDQGFEVYQHPGPTPLPPEVRVQNPTLNQTGTDEAAIETAEEFLRVDGRRRWFLYLHLMDLHEYVYDEESALFGSSYSDIYDNSIHWVDALLETLFEHLSEEGYLENTLIVVASDHGEAFLERGFEGHGRKVYRETTEIPLLVSFPFRLDPGAVVTARTRNIDVWPTILDLLGLSPPEGIDGRSRVADIVASLEGASPEADEEIAIAHLDQTWGQRGAEPQTTVAVVEDTLRYVRVDQPGGAVEQLFDRRDDPRELRDLAGEDPETLERLAAAADGYLAEEPTWGAPPTREVGELELNLLRALGYVIK
jgi:arylsulfatase A-like enzyme